MLLFHDPRLNNARSNVDDSCINYLNMLTLYTENCAFAKVYFAEQTTFFLFA